MVYEVELNDGDTAASINNDLLAANDATTIKGGKVNVLPENGSENGSTYIAGTEYTIVTEDGGINGTLASSMPTDDFANINFPCPMNPIAVSDFRICCIHILRFKRKGTV
ncbi:hypothetical protein PSE_p0098 (plasmid) [Pseudovibrio sp. FO-BEG1]|nr:hypothetical protein PSE_p0098 [Pseudovibrio sp. FO-BEG1]